MKRQFTVIGHPIGHTMSPFLNRRLFELAGKPADYTCRDIEPKELSSALPSLKELEGWNVTIPHKQAILPLLDELDEKASLFRSVNTVKNEGGRLKGYTTDGDGFRFALETAEIPLRGKVLILGAGGVSRVMALESLLAGCQVTVAARSPEKAQKMAEELLAASGRRASVLSLRQLEEDAGRLSFDLAANGTPLGMYPHPCGTPVSLSVLSSCACVFDAVYNPAETLLLRQARQTGARIAGGMSMLVGQAAAAHAIWDGSFYAKEELLCLCEEAQKEMHRIFGGKE